MKKGRGQHRRLVRMREDSPLRSVDARIKLALVVVLTAAVMLSLPRLIVFTIGFVLFMIYARLLTEMLYQLRRIMWLLIALFALDWAFIGLDFSVLITLRVMIVVSCSALFVATTTPEELRQALRGLGVPYRYAFVLSLAFRSVPMMGAELRNIREAQQARGALPEYRGWRHWLDESGSVVALAVPAVVLAARRAWSLTEAAHARGLDSPRRVSLRDRRIDWRDGLVLALTITIMLILATFRMPLIPR
jgi:biotin transport system permease protein